jgi:hypothetical protein
MWTAHASQAEQQYQEAIHGNSPKGQLGSQGVTSSTRSHIWSAIRSLSRTYRQATSHRQATGSLSNGTATLTATHNQGGSSSAPQQASIPDAGDQEQQLPGSSEPPGSASAPSSATPSGDLVEVVVKVESTTSSGPLQYSDSTATSCGPAAPVWYQAGILVQRNIRNWLRWGLPAMLLQFWAGDLLQTEAACACTWST